VEIKKYLTNESESLYYYYKHIIYILLIAANRRSETPEIEIWPIIIIGHCGHPIYRESGYINRI